MKFQSLAPSLRNFHEKRANVEKRSIFAECLLFLLTLNIGIVQVDINFIWNKCSYVSMLQVQYRNRSPIKETRPRATFIHVPHFMHTSPCHLISTNSTVCFCTPTGADFIHYLFACQYYFIQFPRAAQFGLIAGFLNKSAVSNLSGEFQRC